jgi:hypothetical protein
MCPSRSCGRPIDIDFQIGDIPVVAAPITGLLHTVLFESSDGSAASPYQVAFRLPNGADQEALAAIVAVDESHALRVLLARCLAAGGQPPMIAGDIDAWLTTERCLALQAAIAARAPRLDLVIDGVCPECGTLFACPLDIETFFFETARADSDHLRHEVHFLAYHYHWSEQDILAMDRMKRRSYITILADALERMRYVG